jgi:hypothetical protein
VNITYHVPMPSYFAKMLCMTAIVLSRGTIGRAAMLGRRLRKDVVDDFIRSSNRVWGPRFDYSIIEFKHPNVPIKVVCKQHGAFLVAPRDHIYKQKGCPDCQTEKRVRRKETQAALPPSPDLKDFMQQLSPGTKGKVTVDATRKFIPDQ